MSELTHADVDTLLRIIDQMKGQEVHLEIGELKLHVTPGNVPAVSTAASVPETAALAPAPAAVPATKPLPAAIPPGQVAVRAPTMGTFYRADSPGAKPYAQIGDHVNPDDTVGVFEVMKLFSSLVAGVSGTVTAFLVANETLVDQDQPLILIQPD